MSNETDLTTQIETLVREHLSRTHREIAATMDRVFTKAPSATMVTRSSDHNRKRRSPGTRRNSEALTALAERLHEAVFKQPGEAMAVFAAQLGVSVRELHRPMTKLKEAGRLRSVGERSQARYFPGLSVRSGTK
jgi:hypothetical protein